MGSAGDEPTLDRLVERHLDETLRFAIRLTGDPHAAEEVVQDAMLRVARSWKTFRGEAQFRTWLFRIVINVFRDRLSRRTSENEIPADVPDLRIADPAAEALLNELNRLVAAKVSALPPRQREVLVLITYEGLTPGEVAELLGISEANVYSTLHAARQRLRKELAGYLVENSNERE